MAPFICRRCGKPRQRPKTPYCDPCSVERKKERDVEQKAKQKASGYQQAYYRANKERYRAQGRKWIANNRDLANERSREYRRKNPEKHREQWQRWSAKNPDYKRRRYLQTKYGVTLEWFEEQCAKGCSICSAKDIRLVIDHCHSNGKVRGVLCDRCNVALAHENPEWLRAAAAYLERWS